ncbi:hypothetical protein L1987_06139 [Smallanthus sonchifolius]|uniref:Uncharacterized protein n=1 Tax=Smallanthus sonchifolius TaxID=185202 RepID=A0ACB9JX94_9ASTR|nr:hypothetical protein L1987_06139 [Smallanthus sonchifolius]
MLEFNVSPLGVLYCVKREREVFREREDEFREREKRSDYVKRERECVYAITRSPDSICLTIWLLLQKLSFKSLSCKCSQINSVTDVVSEKRDPLLKVGGINSIEDEAWEFLRASMVYYCVHPVGTIAANDPSDSSILNYDQVFIRDFIPSGIAFLLKGEYDIVWNFILHTLQLQVIVYS